MAQTYPIEVLKAFNVSDGSLSMVQGTDGNLYGTTQCGGSGSCPVSTCGCGTIFKIDTHGRTFTTLHSFDQFSDGGGPTRLIKGTDGYLYGLADAGPGGTIYGSIFKIDTNGSTFATLHTFTENDGADPDALIQGTDGNLYGTTAYGGSGNCHSIFSGCGTIFRIDPNGSTFATLHTFTENDNIYPYSLLQGEDGYLYGTTQYYVYGEGVYGGGAIFRTDTSGSVFTTLYIFSVIGTVNSADPYSLVQGKDGYIYGLTVYGGSGSCPHPTLDLGCGTIFRIDGSTVTTLHSFAGLSDGAYPSRLIQGTDGNLYGTTAYGGSGTCQNPINYSGCGTIFRTDTSGSAFTTLHSFTGNDGKYPYWGLIQGTDDNLYGTTVMGGANDDGVVFRLPCPNAGGDTDGDGLCDDWERNGLGVRNTPGFVDLPAMGADPLHKDIFVQADYMKDPGSPGYNGHTHKPKLAAIELVTKAFADAPVDNPDGTTGITLHVDCGPDCVMDPKTGGENWGAMSRANTLVHQDSIEWAQFDQIKSANFLPTGRAPVFHYVVFGHNLSGLDGTSGITRDIPGSDFIVSLGSWCNQTGTTMQQAGTLMHELGHNLGLQHGGSDDVSYKPNFLSVMNYLFQMDGLIINGAHGKCDYSRFLLPNLDETNLDETVGLNGGDALANYGTTYLCAGASTWMANACVGAGASKFVANANGPIDWNCNGFYDTSVATDIHGNNPCAGPGPNGVLDTIPAGDDFVAGNQILDGPDHICDTAAAGDDEQLAPVGTVGPHLLTSYNDWPNLIFDGGAIGHLGSASSLPSKTPGRDEVMLFVNSPGQQEVTPLIDSRITKLLKVTVESPGITQVPAGNSVDLIFTITNGGTQNDTYLLTANSDVSWGNLATVPSTVALNAGASTQITIHVTVPSGTPGGTDGHFTIKATSETASSIQDTGEAAVTALNGLSVTAPWPSPQTVCAGASVSFSVTDSGLSPFTYRWRHNGSNLLDGGSISGATSATLTINPTASGDTGSYDVVVTNSLAQSLASAPGTLTVNNSVPAAPTAGNNGPICAGGPLQLTATTVPGATYSWTGPNGFTSALQNPSIVSATAMASGTYSVTVTVNSCTSPAATTNATVRALPSAAISAPGSVCATSSGNAASVPDAGPGAAYAWMVTNGAITGGQGTRSIVFSAGSSGPVALSVTVTDSNGCVANGSKSVPTFGACVSFFTLAPCRVLDTRNPAAPLGGPALNAGATRTFVLAGHCGIPLSATAVSLNLTLTQSTAAGDLRLFPGGAPLPLVSTVNYGAGQTRANNAITSLGASGDLSIRCDQGSGTVHAIVDVNGYFQ